MITVLYKSFVRNVNARPCFNFELKRNFSFSPYYRRWLSYWLLAAPYITLYNTKVQGRIVSESTDKIPHNVSVGISRLNLTTFSLYIRTYWQTWSFHDITSCRCLIPSVSPSQDYGALICCNCLLKLGLYVNDMENYCRRIIFRNFPVWVFLETTVIWNWFEWSDAMSNIKYCLFSKQIRS